MAKLPEEVADRRAGPACYNRLFPPIAMLLSIKEMEVRKLPFAETWKPNGFDFSDSGVIQKGPLTAKGVAELLPHTGGEVRVTGRVQPISKLSATAAWAGHPFILTLRSICSIGR